MGPAPWLQFTGRWRIKWNNPVFFKQPIDPQKSTINLSNSPFKMRGNLEQTTFFEAFAVGKAHHSQCEVLFKARETDVECTIFASKLNPADWGEARKAQKWSCNLFAIGTSKHRSAFWRLWRPPRGGWSLDGGTWFQTSSFRKHGHWISLVKSLNVKMMGILQPYW